MLPIFFPKNILRQIDLLGFGFQKRAKRCPFFSHDFLGTNRFFRIWVSKEGEMLPIFFPGIFFRDKSIFRFGFQKRAKCCPFFFQEFFRGKSIFLIWVSKEGEMLPNFFPGIFGINRFLDLGFKRGRNAAHFVPKNFLRQIDFRGRVSKQGEMLPIFSQDFLETNRLLDFVFQKRAKCCPFFFPRNFFRDKSIVRLCVSKEGEMLPVFFFPGIFFRDKLIFRLGFHKRAKCCPSFFPRIFFRGKSIFRFGFQKRAKCCPFFFSQNFFFGTNRFLELGFQKRAKCCPFFLKFFLRQIDLMNVADPLGWVAKPLWQLLRHGSFGVGGETPQT